MRYDPQSAFIFTRTDWPSLGAVHNPPPDVPRFGMPLTVWETQALGDARRAAESSRLGSASVPFAQPHPQHAERGIILICTAWCHREGGWTIGLVEPTGQDSPWVLKADIEARLRCACHCDWRPDCPGVVGGGPSAPWAPPPSLGHPPMPQPSPQPITPPPAQQRERRGWFGSRRQAVADPATMAAPATIPSYAAASFDDWSQPTEEYRGSIHAPEPARYADEVLYINAGEVELETVGVARAQPRSFWGGWLGRREEPATAVEALAPPATAESPYLTWADPAAAQLSATPDHRPVDYEPSAPQLAAPADELLSNQAEIESFIEAANSYARADQMERFLVPDPTSEPAPVSYDEPLALPAPEADDAFRQS